MAILIKSSTSAEDKNRWGTNSRTMADAGRVTGFRFLLDVCAEPQTAKCARYIQPWENSLKVNWKDRFHEAQTWVDSLPSVNPNVYPTAAWCNPPFDMKEEFLHRCSDFAKQGMNIVALVPYERGTGWFRRSVRALAQTVYVPDGRYNFVKSDGITKKSGVNFLSCLVHYSPRERLAPLEYVDYQRRL